MGLFEEFCKEERMGVLSLLALVKKSQAISIPPKHLESVAAFVAEDEQMSGKRIFVAEEIADNGEQSVEPSAHIGWLGGDEDTGRWG